MVPHDNVAWAIQKAATRKTGFRGAPFQQRFVSPSKSNSVYEKAAEGGIPAKRMLVRGYSTVPRDIVQFIQKLFCMLNIALAAPLIRPHKIQ